MQKRQKIYHHFQGVAVSKTFARGDKNNKGYDDYTISQQILIDRALENIKADPVAEWGERRRYNRGAGNEFLVSRSSDGDYIAKVYWVLQDGEPIAIGTMYAKSPQRRPGVNPGQF